MNTILSLILETLQAQEKTMKVFEDLIKTNNFRISELEYSENQLKKTIKEQAKTLETLETLDIDYLHISMNALSEKMEALDDSIHTLENIDIEDELRNSCTFTELEEKVLELEEPQGFISDIGNKSFIESNREELDGLKERIKELETILKSVGEALNK
jgi:hypothetical protein